jgi:tetratricopeptide (TPR) repeat protein
MTSPLLSKISKTLLCSLLFCLTYTVSSAQTQEYSEDENKAYEEIKAATDPIKKIELSTKFFAAKPKTSVKDNVLYEYHAALQELREAKNWSSIINLGDKFLDAVPTDETTFGFLTAAYESTGNTKGFATYGEKMYASKPSAQLASAIAYAYLKLENEAKFIQWGEKVLVNDPDNVVIAGEITGKHLRNRNYPQATKYARMCLKALPTAKKPGNIDTKDWKNYTDTYYFNAYYTLGAAAFEANQFAQAIPNLENAAKYNKRFDTIYYCLGMSYWQTNKMQPAMLNFAKAVVLKGNVAASSKQNLEKIWKGSHRGALTGIDTVYDKAKQDLK